MKLYLTIIEFTILNTAYSFIILAFYNLIYFFSLWRLHQIDDGQPYKIWINERARPSIHRKKVLKYAASLALNLFCIFIYVQHSSTWSYIIVQYNIQKYTHRRRKQEKERVREKISMSHTTIYSAFTFALVLFHTVVCIVYCSLTVLYFFYLGWIQLDPMTDDNVTFDCLWHVTAICVYYDVYCCCCRHVFADWCDVVTLSFSSELKFNRFFFIKLDINNRSWNICQKRWITFFLQKILQTIKETILIVWPEKPKHRNKTH